MSIVGLTFLCTPAKFYLIISIIALVVMSFQNFGTKSVYCIGNFSCDVNSVYTIFFAKLFYIIICTWFLNIICRNVSTTLAWLIALIPFLLFFISIFIMFYKNA